ncbi:MAG: BON domain-containing protein [Chloroflexi bacterium]|nr:BON domain-containing protein [Chloroflexota bacterium]
MARYPYPEREPEARSFPAAGAGLPGQAPTRSDVDICRDIESALFYDGAVKSVDIKVECQQGIVTLRGSVETEHEKRLAEEDARNIPGVEEVRNELRMGVRG